MHLSATAAEELSSKCLILRKFGTENQHTFYQNEQPRTYVWCKDIINIVLKPGHLNYIDLTCVIYISPEALIPKTNHNLMRSIVYERSTEMLF
jgi:hypothetical protein